jgi:hypothetical protein
MTTRPIAGPGKLPQHDRSAIDGDGLTLRPPLSSAKADATCLSGRRVGWLASKDTWRSEDWVLRREAEFERTLILSRTTDDRLAAKARCGAFGRPKKMRPDQRELAGELVRDGKSISAVAGTFNIMRHGILFLSAAQALHQRMVHLVT